MSKIKSIGLALLVIALLLPVMAFAKGLHSMDISGPGIDGTLHLTDQNEMMNLMDSSFFDMSEIVRLTDEEAAALGQGYEFTMHIAESPEEEPFHAEVGVYYPDPEGGRGYIHWIGAGDPAVEIMAKNEWTHITARGEAAFWSLMASHGVTRPEISAPAVDAARVAESESVKPAQAVVDAEVVASDDSVVSNEVAQAPQRAPMNWTGIAVGAALILLVGAGAWVIRKRQAQVIADPAAASD